LKEEAENILYLDRDSDGKINKNIYASKTTLETEETSFSKLDDDTDSVVFEKRDSDYPLSLSALSSGEMSSEEKFVSPTFKSSANKIPLLNLDKVKKIITMNSTNLSELSTANHSLIDSKVESNFAPSSENSQIARKTSNDHFEETNQRFGHFKKMSHDKPIINKKPAKPLANQYKKQEVVTNKTRKSSNEDNEKSWRDMKIKATKPGFKGNHWDFTKKNTTCSQK